MNNGWIKLHRNLLNNCISAKPEYAWFWVSLLLMANHTETFFMWNGKKQKLKKGQILTGRKKLSNKTGINESKVERILKYLEIEQQIEQQKTNKFRLITIKNWNQYQESEQHIEQQLNNKRTTTEHIQECKEGKECKKRNTISVSDKISLKEAEAIYEKYPRKKGKVLGLKKLMQLKKVDIPKIEAGFNQFIGLETRFIPHFSTYVNQRRWEDEGSTHVEKENMTKEQMQKDYEKFMEKKIKAYVAKTTIQPNQNIKDGWTKQYQGL